MNRTAHAIATASRIALLGLMLAVQGFAYAHEVDHLAPVDGKECAACVAGHAFGAAVPATHEPPAVEHAPSPAWRAPAACDREVATVPFGARAPPHRS